MVHNDQKRSTSAIAIMEKKFSTKEILNLLEHNYSYIIYMQCTYIYCLYKLRDEYSGTDYNVYINYYIAHCTLQS